MGVKFKTFANVSPGGGSSGTLIAGLSAETFSDDFNRADTPVGLGTNWLSHHSRPTSAGIYSLARILTLQMRGFNSGGAGNPNPGSYWFPIPTLSQLWGRSQFAQATFAGMTVVTGPASGPCVQVTSCILANDANGYNLEATSATTAELVRFASGAFNIIGSGTYVIAAGDILRISTVMGVASNVIRVSRNGVVIDTITDSAASRPAVAGSPAHFHFYQNGDSSDWDNFSCGPGL